MSDRLGLLTRSRSTRSEATRATASRPLRDPFRGMCWRRAPPEARNGLVGTPGNRWRPIEQVQGRRRGAVSDADDPPGSRRANVDRSGQARSEWWASSRHAAPTGHEQESIRSELANAFADIEPSSYRAVPDELLPSATVVVPTICREPARLVRP